jgi:3-phenylpropionate/cinnamic acid dioxygenase small subunit
MSAVDRVTPGHPGTSSRSLRESVEEFLIYEATLLDGWQLEEWLELFTLDCRYLVPTTDRPDGDPDRDLFLIQDDRFLLTQRVDAIVKGTNRAESPRSTTHRMISNVRAAEVGDGTVDARAQFLVHRIRGHAVDVYPGRYEMVLRPGGRAGFEIHVRKAVLALEELRPHGRVSFIL